MLLIYSAGFCQSAKDYLSQGDSKYNSGDYKGAIEDYNKAIRLEPYNAEAYFRRGNANGILENYKEAINDFTRVIIINFKKNLDIPYYNRGIAKIKLQDYEGAAADFSKAIENNPKYTAAYFNRGISKFLLNDKDGACFDWGKAKELGSDKAYELYQKYCK